jgi:hypothetical protein
MVGGGGREEGRKVGGKLRKMEAKERIMVGAGGREEGRKVGGKYRKEDGGIGRQGREEFVSERGRN